MGDQTIIVPELYLLSQVQVLLAHFEKDIYIPTRAIQPYDFLIGDG